MLRLRRGLQGRLRDTQSSRCGHSQVLASPRAVFLLHLQTNVVSCTHWHPQQSLQYTICEKRLPKHSPKTLAIDRQPARAIAGALEVQLAYPAFMRMFHVSFPLDQFSDRLATTYLYVLVCGNIPGNSANLFLGGSRNKKGGHSVLVVEKDKC